jgi:hypothetical protein
VFVDELIFCIERRFEVGSWCVLQFSLFSSSHLFLLREILLNYLGFFDVVVCPCFGCNGALIVVPCSCCDGVLFVLHLFVVFGSKLFSVECALFAFAFASLHFDS